MRLKIIVVEPDKEPYTKVIKNSLQNMQRIVGGYIEVIHPFAFGEIALVCNEEGKIRRLPPNRMISDVNNEKFDMIHGTFFLCRTPIESDEMVSIPDDLIETYLSRFSLPEVI